MVKRPGWTKAVCSGLKDKVIESPEKKISGLFLLGKED
jgi:hypothetical protein